MNKTYLFEVCESGYERHDGEFYKSFLLTDKLQDALKKYNEILNSVKKENDFFLRNHINEAQEGTHTPSAYDYSWSFTSPFAAAASSLAESCDLAICW